MSAIESLKQSGYALLSATEASSALGIDGRRLNSLGEWWARLPRDQYLRDGGRYRSRRHSCFVQDFKGPANSEGDGTLLQVPHRAHWQPTSYNALHGGIERWFEPIAAQVVGDSIWSQLLLSIGSVFRQVRVVDRWYIEAHQFRIDTTDGIGRPTPEGAHRDGVDFVALLLVKRQNVRGGETRVFDAHGPTGVRFTMSEPWSLLMMDDERVIHETTPIQPEGEGAIRDTLVLTYRASGFQAP